MLPCGTPGLSFLGVDSAFQFIRYLPKLTNQHKIFNILYQQFCILNLLDYRFWIAGCQMTPTSDDIIFDRWHGLRDMADRINRNVTEW